MVRGRLTGLLYLESAEAGRFGAATSGSCGIGPTSRRCSRRGRPGQAGCRACSGARARAASRRAVTYYQADDSVFIDGEYLIRGIQGGSSGGC